ncbi:BadF/BadG/BcrA/BcrD ATPase family protein [Kitasatospora sp. NPDC002040]|uniref:N-acetylglucosamine kinase n=1 Tax=Kitasatospora sp. NPDC002040 TaxID=3154661 RepID=UPI00331C6CB3
MPAAELLLGLDVGGTGTRAQLTDPTGRRLGSAHGPGANPGTCGEEQAAARIATAVRTATEGHDPARIAACVIGLAGYRRFADDAARRAFAARCGLPADRTFLRPDAEVAFAAGTDAPDGTVLIAGTGAVACDLRQGRVTAVRGGAGWLLGDEGSGHWLGREGARHTLRAVQDGAPDALSTAVLAHLGLPPAHTPATAAALLHVLHAAPSTAPAGLAPLVGRAAAAGLAPAVAITERAARHLAALLPAVPSGPLVLAGGVAASPGPVREALTALLPRPAVLARDTAMAAAWLAARLLAPGAPHAAFLGEG